MKIITDLSVYNSDHLTENLSKSQDILEDFKESEKFFKGELSGRIENLSKQFSGTSNRNKISKNTSFYP
jgi:hypothetical protein